MNNIYDLTLEDMESFFIDNGSKKFHALQLFSWLYDKRVEKFEDMSNISHEMINKLVSNFSIERLKIVDIQDDVDVSKYLFELSDGEHIEAVLMRHDYGNSICVSSQVGCNMGCRFCESGRRKKVRNLEVHEMVLQIIMIEKLLHLIIIII